MPGTVGADEAIRKRSSPTDIDANLAWKPGFCAFLVPFALFLVLNLWFYRTGSSPLSWPLTLLWSIPAASALVGLQGAFLLRCRLRRQNPSEPWRGESEDFLIVLVPTIGRNDTYTALERSVRSFVEHLPSRFARMRVDVVTEEGCEAHERISALQERLPMLRVITVPKTYQTANRTRFKARANQYSLELRAIEGEAGRNVWVLHMDDDTAVGADTAAALANFVEEQRFVSPGTGKHLAQGILTYPRENSVNYVTWLADAVRPAEDISRFYAMTGLGSPLAGVHGELLLIRASVEAEIGWDFGPESIVEDAHFALVFSRLHPGRSAWFNGRCYGASPATVPDFIKQRQRWAWGLAGLCFNRAIPWRQRWFLSFSVFTWLLGPFQHILAVLVAAWIIGDMDTSPVTQSVMILWSINLAYTVWAYWEGIRLNAKSSRDKRRRVWEPFLVICLIPAFSLLEGLGMVRGFSKFLRREKSQFTVIAKPV